MPIANVVDEQSDPQVETLARLLVSALRSKFGAGVVTDVYHWPIRIEAVPTFRAPALAVYRTTDRFEAGDHVDDFATLNVRIDYYAPITPLDRIEVRWPLLRAVVQRVRGVIQVGWHPSYVDEDAAPIRLSGVGIEAPTSVGGQAAYRTASADGGVIPLVEITATIRSSELVDLTDYPLDDLKTIRAEGHLDESDDPDDRAFESIVGEMPDEDDEDDEDDDEDP